MSNSIKAVKGHFSAINGTSVRHVYSEDGKVRHKDTLEAAYKTIRRAN